MNEPIRFLSRTLAVLERSRLGQAAVGVVIRRFGGGPLLAPVIRILVDSWGVSYVDLQAVLRHMSGASPEAWAASWSWRAAHYAVLGDQMFRRGMIAAARDLYAKASLYFQAGHYALSDDSPFRAQLYRKVVETFHKFGTLCRPPIRWLELACGGGTLHAYVRLPSAAGTRRGPVPVVIVVPGLGSTKEQPDYRVELLLDRGMAICVLDLPGHGQSRASLGLDMASYASVSTAIDGLTSLGDVDMERVGLLGTSLGGAVAIRAAAEDSRVRAVASIAGFYEPRHWYAQSAPYVDAALRSATRDPSGIRTHELVQAMTLHGALRDLAAPVLLVHGDADLIVPVGEVHKIASELPTSPELLVLSGGDHAATNVMETRLFVADWLEQQLAREPRRDPGTQNPYPEFRASREGSHIDDAKGAPAIVTWSDADGADDHDPMREVQAPFDTPSL